MANCAFRSSTLSLRQLQDGSRRGTGSVTRLDDAGPLILREQLRGVRAWMGGLADAFGAIAVDLGYPKFDWLAEGQCCV